MPHMPSWPSPSGSAHGLYSVQSRVRFCVIHPLKIPMTPKTESRGSKMTPCNFCANLNFLVPTSKTMIYFSGYWLSRAVKISDTDQTKTHLLYSILICIYSVRFSAQHYKQSNTLIFPLHHMHCHAQHNNVTVCEGSMLGAPVPRPDSTNGCNNVSVCTPRVCLEVLLH